MGRMLPPPDLDLLYNVDILKLAQISNAMAYPLTRYW